MDLVDDNEMVALVQYSKSLPPHLIYLSLSLPNEPYSEQIIFNHSNWKSGSVTSAVK